MSKPNLKLAKKKENPSCIIERRPNVGKAYNDKNIQLPQTELVAKASNLEAAIQQIKSTGDKKYVYKIFQNKALVKELCWNDKQQWHQPLGFIIHHCCGSSIKGLRSREGKKYVEEHNKII